MRMRNEVGAERRKESAQRDSGQIAEAPNQKSGGKEEQQIEKNKQPNLQENA